MGRLQVRWSSLIEMMTLEQKYKVYEGVSQGNLRDKLPWKRKQLEHKHYNRYLPGIFKDQKKGSQSVCLE